MIQNIDRIIKKIIIENPVQIGAFPNNKLDRKVITVLVLVPFCLAMIAYFGKYYYLRTLLVDLGADSIVSYLDGYFSYISFSNLNKLTYWVLILSIFYVIVPSIAIKLIFRENISDYGLKLKGAFKDYYLYLLMLLVMIPLVAYFSNTSTFQTRYPFLKVSPGESLFPDLLIWEMLYFLQFFALEFFFRGFMTFSLRNHFGIYSVFIMTIPYCMIHFGKPLPETLAAIIAGIVLGFLSLKNKSIWLGVLLHCSVGIAMDVASLLRKGINLKGMLLDWL